MPPQSTRTNAQSPSSSFNPQEQSVYIIRHGDRWDYQHPEWKETAERKGDPSLSSLGHEQARQAGGFLDQLFVQEGIHADQITLLSSPFLRTIQTSNELLAEMKLTKCKGSTCSAADSIKIQPEFSVFEVDLRGQGYHASLPPQMNERQCYFPRIDGDYQTMFVPSLPEDKDQFFDRCDSAMEHIARNFPCDNEKHPVIIVVTHAACCIGLVKSAAGLELEDINPAAPCSIYRLRRTTNENRWSVDHYSKKGGMNGFTGHMKDIGTCTQPWNNFGERDTDNGYTGPPKQD